MTLTDEQSAFVDFTLGSVKKKQPQWILVNAVAGTGKSKTLSTLTQKIQNQDEKLRIKYVVFNKSMQQEAEEKGFVENTDISTINSFAFQQVRKFKKLDLTINYDIKLIKSLLKENVSEADIYKATLLLEDFFKSGDLKIDEFYSKIEVPDNNENIDFGSIMKNIFQLMHTDKIKQSHGYYMKLFHKLVIDGHISLKDEYDVIMLDECFPGYMYVKTGEGTITFNELYNKYINNEKLPLVKSFNEKTKKFELKQITNVMKQGYRDIYEIKTEGLNIIHSTDNHKYLTQRGWIEAKNLIIGKDYLILDNIENQKCKLIPSEKQLQMILGSYLGDGSLNKRSKFNTYRIRFTQGEKQKDYLLWKMKALYKNFNLKKIKSGYTNKLSIYHTNNTNTFILNDNPFNLVLSKLDTNGLAIWCMDDGSLVDKRFVIHSNSFSYEENIKLKNMLKEKFNLNTSIKQNRKYFELQFSTSETKKLLSIIKKYIHKYFIEKWNLEPNDTCYNWTSSWEEFGGNFITSVKYIGKEYVYDITVENNHNFIVKKTKHFDGSGIVAHNCQDTSAVFYEALKALNIPIKICVGDKYQNVYNFIGTVSIFEQNIESKVEFGFTKSFRLTEEIAEKATEFMQEFLDDKFEIKGLNTDTNDNSILYLSRNNAALIKQMIELMNNGKKFKLLRDYKSIFGTLIALMNASAGRWKYIDSTKYKWIFNDYNIYVDLDIRDEQGKPISFFGFLFNKYIELGNTEITSGIRLILDLGPQNLFNVYKHVKDSLYYKSNITLSTVHTAKGSEAGTVVLLEDIKKMKNDFIKDKKKLEKEEFIRKHKHELYLYYTALTRAKHTIIGD